MGKLPDDVYEKLLIQKQEAYARIDFLLSQRDEIVKAACVKIDAEIAEAREAKDKVMEIIVYHFVPYMDDLSETNFTNLNTLIQNTILADEDKILGA